MFQSSQSVRRGRDSWQRTSWSSGRATGPAQCRLRHQVSTTHRQRRLHWTWDKHSSDAGRQCPSTPTQSTSAVVFATSAAIPPADRTTQTHTRHHSIRYDMTCNQKLTWLTLIYCMEPTALKVEKHLIIPTLKAKVNTSQQSKDGRSKVLCPSQHK